jgi:hypothetical protein
LPDITSYAAIVTAEGSDVMVIVDVSDLTMSPAGTTKQITLTQLSAAVGGGGGGSGYALLAGAAFTGYVAPCVVALTYGTSVAVNASLGNDFRLTLTASTATIANPASPADGQDIKFQITQDSAGSRTLAGWGSAYDFGAAGAPTLSTAAGKTDILGFCYNASLGKWCYLGSALGF